MFSVKLIILTASVNAVLCLSALADGVGGAGKLLSI